MNNGLQAWYAAVTPFAVAFYDPLDSPVIRKPRWASPFLVRLLVQLQPFARACLAVLGLLCAVYTPRLELQAAFAVAVTVLDFYSFHMLNCHLSFVLMYSSWALLLQGPQQKGVLLVITIHQLTSSGMQKCRVGGLKWTSPETFAQTLRNSLSTAQIRPAWITEPNGIKQRGLIRAVLERPWLCRLSAVGGLAFEVALFPAAAVVPSLRLLALAAATVFHSAIALLHGIIFIFSVPCYALALWGDSEDGNWQMELLNAPTFVTAGILAWTTLSSVESWPFNHIGLFPYNYEQVKHLSTLFGKFTLKLESTNVQPCLAELTVQGFPSAYHPIFCDAVGTQSGSAPSRRVTIQRLQKWLDTSPFLEVNGFKPLTAGCLQVNDSCHKSHV